MFVLKVHELNTDILLLNNDRTRLILVSSDSICINCMVQFNRTSNLHRKIEIRWISYSVLLFLFFIFGLLWDLEYSIDGMVLQRIISFSKFYLIL